MSLCNCLLKLESNTNELVYLREENINLASSKVSYVYSLSFIVHRRRFCFLQIMIQASLVLTVYADMIGAFGFSFDPLIIDNPIDKLTIAIPQLNRACGRRETWKCSCFASFSS